MEASVVPLVRVCQVCSSRCVSALTRGLLAGGSGGRCRESGDVAERPGDHRLHLLMSGLGCCQRAGQIGIGGQVVFTQRRELPGHYRGFGVERRDRLS